MRYILAVLGLLILLVGGVFWYSRSKPVLSPSPSPSPTTLATSSPNNSPSIFCTPSQLQPQIQSEGAAGNIYLTLSLKNNSSTTCNIVGSNLPTVSYPNSVTNFKTVAKGTASSQTFTLAPNQTIYSLIHYPNGPQCSSQATDVNSTISYKISDQGSITFQPNSQYGTVNIPSCGKNSDITTIDLYYFSNQEVLPQ